MPQHVERDAVPPEQLINAIEHVWGHGPAYFPADGESSALPAAIPAP